MSSDINFYLTIPTGRGIEKKLVLSEETDHAPLIFKAEPSDPHIIPLYGPTLGFFPMYTLQNTHCQHNTYVVDRTIQQATQG